MSFDPQPYAVIVDDLLTALTGGQVREELRFRQGTWRYALKHALDEGRVAFVKVVGERAGAFTLFERGKDYDVSDGAILWRSQGGQLPDVDTSFYANYYEAGYNAPLTDRFVGSVTRTLAEAFALEYALLQQALKAAYDTAFVETATGSALDQVVAILGIVRRDAQYATGAVQFGREVGAGDILIPAGTPLRTAVDPPRVFETTLDKTLPDGQLQIAVPIRATALGQAGLAQPGEIRVMVRPIAGITTVSNAEQTASGQAAETDAELRSRAKRAVEQAGRATPAALSGALSGVPGVRSVELREDLEHEPGRVRLTVDCSEASVAQVLSTLEATRAAGVRFEHNLGAPAEGAGAGQVTLPKLAAEVRLWLTLSDASAPQANVVRTLNAVREAASAYLNGLPVGQALAPNKLVSLALGVAGVADVAELRVRRLDTTPPQDVPAGQSLAAPAGGKIVVAASALSVEAAGAPVYVDIVLQFQSLAAGATDAKLAAQPVLDAYLQGGGSALGLTDIWQKLVSAGHTPAQVQVTAEYSASGASVTRTLTNGGDAPGPANQFKIAPNERPLLRQLDARVLAGG